MSEFQACQRPEDLCYDLDYVWARPGDDGTFTIGVTDPAQTMSGRLHKPRVKNGGTHQAGCRTPRGHPGKRQMAACPCPSPARWWGHNELLLEDPHLINIDPYGDTWIALILPGDGATVPDRLHSGPEAQEALRAWVRSYDVQCLHCSD